jgi:ATP-dependent helicase/nuclease subunit B
VNDAGEATLLVVESEAQVRYAHECGKRALTRDSLAERLLASLAPTIALASDLVVRRALSEALEHLAEAEGWLATFMERGGRAWADLVGAVMDSLREAHEMTWLGSVTRAPSVAKDARARVVFAAGERLDRELARHGLGDPGARDALVTEALAVADPANIVRALGSRRVVATGIASWGPLDLSLWRALDARLSLVGGNAAIELRTFDRPFDAARPLDPLGRLVDAVAEALDDAPQTRPIGAVLGDFAFTGKLSAESSDRVEVRQADSRAAGARAVLDAVARALAAGACPEDIAVVVPEPRDGGEQPSHGSRGWSPTIARALAEAQIPAYSTVDGEGPRGLMACALGALVVADHGLTRLDLARVLQSRYLNAPGLTGLPGQGEARALLDRLAHVLETTPTAEGDGTVDSLEKTVLAFKGRERNELEAMALLARRVAEAFERARRGTTLEEHVTHTRHLFEVLGLHAETSPHLAAHWAQDGRAVDVTEREVEAYARDARGASRLDATLDAYEAVARTLHFGAAQSFSSFCIELEDELSRPSDAQEARAAGAVRIATLRELTGRPLSLLVFADAHEGSLERETGRYSLFDGGARAELTLGIEPALRASAKTATQAERIRLAAAADAAAQSVLVYATRDDEGGISPPDSFVAWLIREGVRTTSWRDKVVVTHPLTSHEARLLSFIEGGDQARSRDPLVLARAAIESARESAFGLPARSADDVAARELRPEVRAILLEETGGGSRSMPVTALDRFGACLFQGFAAQVLRARRSEILDEIIDPREEGTLLHGALAAAFGATRELWASRPRDAARIRSLADRAATEALARAPAASRLRRAALREIREAVLRVVAWSLADEQWDFSRAETAQTVVLDDNRGKITLRGSADRVDMGHGRDELRVIDYKRGEEGARRLTSELGETSFQIAVYAKGASEALNVPATAGVYLPTRRLAPSFVPKDTAGAWGRSHALEDGTPHFVRRALDLVTRVRSGDIEARPANPETCRTCDFDGICRKPRFVILSALEEEEETRDGG